MKYFKNAFGFFGAFLCSMMLNLSAMDAPAPIIGDDARKPARKYNFIKDSATHHKSLDALRSKKAGHIHSKHPFLKSVLGETPLPTSVDLRSSFPFPPFDQGSLGSCTANAIIGLATFALKSNPVMLSRLDLYYKEREYMGTTSWDSGASNADGILALIEQGVCKESSRPYDVSKFTEKSSPACYAESASYMDLDSDYQNTASVQLDKQTIKKILASGYPLVVGIAVYESFESPTVTRTGKVPMPNLSTEICLGGHAVDIVGYSDSDSTWLMRNSWGANWGNKGYFTLPFDYISGTQYLASDAWVIKKFGSKGGVTPIPPTPSLSTVSVAFTAKNVRTVWGQNVYIIGNTTELGNWDTSKAVLLNCVSSYPDWSINITLPATKNFLYKYIKKFQNQVIWLRGNDLPIATSNQNSTKIDTNLLW